MSAEEVITQESLMAEMPVTARRHVDPSSPMPMRMMASKGMAPLPPGEMVMVLCALSLDQDEKIASGAGGTLAGLPDDILGAALGGSLSASSLSILGPVLVDRPDALEKVVLNNRTTDTTIAQLAPIAPAVVAEIIASNQQRCLRSEAIVLGIAKNKEILQSSLDRLFDFLVRSGVIIEGMSEFLDALARLSPTQMVEMADNIELPPLVSKLVEDSPQDDAKAEEAARHLEKRGGDDEESKEERIPMLKLIGSLAAAQKVALALKGNKEARTILIRDTNKVVASATIRSPRITEQEIVAAAQSRTVCDDVIRIIARTKDMMRSYGVKLALVSNPKTPLPTAMRFLTLLRQNDVKVIAKSKGIPSALANQAKRMIAARGKK